MKPLAVALLAVCLPLGACQTTEGEGAKTMLGQNMGSLQFKDIDLDRGKLTLPSNHGLAVRSVKEGNLPNRYNQRIQFADGYFVLELVYASGFPSETTAKEIIFLSRSYTFNGEKIFPDDTSESEVHRSGDVRYLTRTVQNRPCVAFSRVFGRQFYSSSEQLHEAWLRGIHCGAPATDMGSETTRILGIAASARLRGS